jgi:hypothetical protein
MMYTIQNGKRLLKFNGEKLAHSSSKTKQSVRWVEFTLYRTTNGQYVLERTGISVIYHSVNCPVTRRNNSTVTPLPSEAISDSMVPCQECRPTREYEQYLVPESARHRAQVCQTAASVVSSLKQFDDNNTEYLTNVASRLLEQASELDPLISDAYYVEYI